MLLKIGVNLARCDGCQRVPLARPGTNFRLSGREIRYESARLPDGSGDAPEARLVDAVTGAHLGLLGGVKLAQLGLEPSRQDDHRSALSGSHLRHPGGRLSTVRQKVVRGVGDVNGG